MPVLIIETEIMKQNHDEFINTVRILLDRFRKSRGCEGYQLNRDFENENLFQLISTWQMQQDLDAHASSADFVVLQGAIEVELSATRS